MILMNVRTPYVCGSEVESVAGSVTLGVRTMAASRKNALQNVVRNFRGKTQQGLLSKF